MGMNANKKRRPYELTRENPPPLQLYGVHPWWWYVFAGVPAVLGVWTVPYLLNLKVRECQGAKSDDAEVGNVCAISTCIADALRTVMSPLPELHRLF